MTPIELIQNKIYTIRGVNVMLDRDLAELYEVTTGNLNLAVKRNLERFSEEFMFQLSRDEVKNLKLQFAISSWGGTRKNPYVFTEYGTLMLASILRSAVAININKIIIRAFVEMRRLSKIYPEYDLLKERIRRIESEVRESKTERQIETRLVEGKLTNLSRNMLDNQNKVEELHTMLSLFSSVLDEFEKAHIIIKRPEDGLGNNHFET